MSRYYHTCPECGANLDPGEICDCRLETKSKERTEYHGLRRDGNAVKSKAALRQQDGPTKGDILACTIRIIPRR